MKKSVLLFVGSLMVFLVFLSGCGGADGGGASTSGTAQLIDSAVAGVDYETDSRSGVTGSDGSFKYNAGDTTVTFKIGTLKLADFNLAQLKSDRKILPVDLVGADRSNTTDANLVKILRVLQSLDSDSNATNGITIDDNTKNAISLAIDNNASYSINIADNNITTLKVLVVGLGKSFRLERDARIHYKTTLASLGIIPQSAPFTTVWEVSGSDLNITIPTNPDYTYDYNISWGDGESNTFVDGNITHTYQSDGNYTVSISGDFPAIYFNDTGDRNKIKMITQWGDIEWKSFYKTFYGCENIDMNATDTPDLTQVTNMSYMFSGEFFGIGSGDIVHINGIKDNDTFNDWDVSHVTNMHHMFTEARYFNQSLNNWNVSNVTDMSLMFDGARAFNQDISSWDVHNVTDMKSMFHYATAFNQPLNSWNVSSATDMTGMFYGASAFSNHDLSGWNVSNVTSHTDFMTNAGSGNTEPNWP